MKESGLGRIDAEEARRLVAIFCFLTALVYTFPYSGDDWAWGGRIGLDRLRAAFRGYNGRYAGNLLVLVLTRSNFLRIAAVSSSLLLLAYLAQKYCGGGRKILTPFSVFLSLIVSNRIFAQSVVWTSGYSNYAPPALIALFYLCVTKNAFEEELPQYPRYAPFLTAVLGFVGALFMENVSLYALAIAVFVIVFSYLRFKRFYLTHIFYFLGGLAGTILMFSNSAYRSVAAGKDSYRSVAFGEELKKTFAGRVEIIVRRFFMDNLFVFLIISVLCAATAAAYMEKNVHEKRKRAFAQTALVCNVTSLGLLFAKKELPEWDFWPAPYAGGSFSRPLFGLIICIYCFSILSVVVLCVGKKSVKYKLTFLLLNIPVIIAPLTVVDPVGPRCFFPPYATLIFFTTLLFDYVLDETGLKPSAVKRVGILISSAGLAVFIFLFSIYSTVRRYDVRRREYVERQLNAGYDVVKICRLPYKSFVWTGDPENDTLAARYKQFYGIDNNVRLEPLDPDEFDAWAKEFDARGAQK